MTPKHSTHIQTDSKTSFNKTVPITILKQLWADREERRNMQYTRKVHEILFVGVCSAGSKVHGVRTKKVKNQWNLHHQKEGQLIKPTLPRLDAVQLCKRMMLPCTPNPSS